MTAKCKELDGFTKDTIYAELKNVMIQMNEDKIKNEEFTIVINIFLSGKEYNIF